MFRVKADCNAQIEIKCSQSSTYDFFSEARNWVALLPSLESLTAERDGAWRWTVRAEVPMLGAMRVPFRVERAEIAPSRIEYTPAPGEQQNYLRCVAAFSELGLTTRISVAQALELRRAEARALHPLAAMAGATRIGAEVQRQMAVKLQEFLQAVRTRLET